MKEKSKIKIYELNGMLVKEKEASRKVFGLESKLYAKIQTNREINALKMLEGIKGIPRFIKKNSETSFISEYIPGKTIEEAKDIRDDYFNNLFLLMAEMHNRGVANMDFANEKNILVTKEGKPALIDFAASVFYNEWPFEYTKGLNINYFYKRKLKYKPELITEDERKIASTQYSLIAKTFRILVDVKRYIRKKLE